MATLARAAVASVTSRATTRTWSPYWLDEVGEVLRVARGRDKTMAPGEHGLREREAESARAAGDEPDLGHARKVKGASQAR